MRHHRPVLDSTDPDQPGAVLVDAALEEGEPVVIEGIQRLRPGLPVRVTALEQSS